MAASCRSKSKMIVAGTGNLRVVWGGFVAPLSLVYFAVSSEVGNNAEMTATSFNFASKCYQTLETVADIFN
jgi:hypothetical protein